jgi:FkbM family methyltransferase
MIPGFVDRLLSNAPGRIGALYHGYRDYRWGDPHLRLVAALADPKRLGVDIGANRGEFTFFIDRHAAGCVAFECNPNMRRELQQRFGRSVDIRGEAVSDHAGTAELRIPRAASGPASGRATIETANALEGSFVGFDLVQVDTIPLDDAIDAPVGLIKIDVEGHELAVLRGAMRILARDRPNLIVELEERHMPGCVQAAHDLLAPLGYVSTYLQDGTLRPFDPAHPPAGPLWNYVFTCPR